MKILKNCVFQAYGVENIKLVASERRSSIVVPKMVLFPKIYFKKKFFFHLIFEKWLIFSWQQFLAKWMNCLTDFFSSSKIKYGVFLKRSNLLLLLIFIGFYFFQSSPNKMRLFLNRINFYFFQRTDSLKSYIKQPSIIPKKSKSRN